MLKGNRMKGTLEGLPEAVLLCRICLGTPNCARGYLVYLIQQLSRYISLPSLEKS